MIAFGLRCKASETLIDGVPHSLHFQFTARCNRRCLLLAIMIIGMRDGVNIEKDDDDSDDRSL